MGSWIVEGTECVDAMATLQGYMMLDEIAEVDNEFTSVLSVLAGHCCEGDYCIMKPQQVAEWYQGHKIGALIPIMETLREHQWEGFDYDKARKIVGKLIELNLVELRWVEWNGDKIG